MPRIIAICPKEFVGVSAVLTHGAKLGYWKHIFLGDEVPENDILLLGAWHPEYWKLLDKYNCGAYITSTIGQMEFSWEQVELHQLDAIRELYKAEKLKFALVGWRDVLWTFNKRERVFYCPYPFYFKDIEEIKTKDKFPKSVGIYLPNSPRKNLMNQYLAAKACSTEIYTNLNFGDKNIHYTGWLERTTYLNLLSRLTTTLHCTYTESFSYAAAESLVAGTIPIVSFQVAQNLGLANATYVCPQCDSIAEIAMPIRRLFSIENKNYQEILAQLTTDFKKTMGLYQEQTKLVLDKIGKL